MKAKTEIRSMKLILLKQLILFLIVCCPFALNAQAIIAEAEDGVLQGPNTRIESSESGFSGTGYVNGFESEADGVLVKVNIETAGKYTLSVGYSAPYGNKANFITLNGASVATVQFYEIHSFTEMIVGDFDFVQGENTIGFVDSWGWCLLDYFKITDIAPRGDFTYTPSAVATGDTITFDATETSDPNGTIDLYEWDFGDGTSASGMIVKHVFKAAKIVNVKLTMTDNDGNSSTISKQVDVSRAEPYAVFSSSTDYPEPSVSIDFDGSLSYDLSDTIESWEWDFGDGNSATGKTTSHAFATEGNYPVSLTVTNKKGKSDTRISFLYVYNSGTVLRGPSLLTRTPKTNEKIEFGFQVEANYTNPFDPDEIMVDAVVTYPGDTDSIIVPCFYFEEASFISNNWVLDSTIEGWRCRISVPNAGDYSIKLKYSGSETLYSNSLSFSVVSGDELGIIHNDTVNNQYYRHTGGEPFYPMGINIGWSNMEGYGDILSNISTYGANIFRYWHTPFAQQALEWSDNSFYDGLGHYSQRAAQMTDSLVNLGKELGVCMQLTLFQHGPFSENVDPIWYDNPYNSVNGGFVDNAEAYFYNSDCKHYAKKLLRYVVARWGYSPNIFAWEFFNEVNFSGNHPEQTSQWYNGVQQWHSEMANYVKSIDAFNHITTTSVSGYDDMLYDFDSIEALDVIQYHLYETDLLTEQKKHDYTFKDDLNRAIINGEYGGAGSTSNLPLKWQQISLWNSIFTEVPHFMWDWGNFDLVAWGKAFELPTDFLQDEDLAANTNLVPTDFYAAADDLKLQTTSLADDSTFYGVAYDLNGNVLLNGYIDSIQLAYGNYDIDFYSGTSNKTMSYTNVPLVQAYNRIEFPDVVNEVAFKIKFNSPYTLPIAIAGSDKFIPLGNTITFDGSNSIDPNDLSLNYSWNLISKPTGSTLNITEASTSTIDVKPDISGYYYLTLQVNNGTDYSLPDTVLLVSSTKPVADAGKDTIIAVRTVYPLDGTGSYDADGEALTYLWEVAVQPDGARSGITDYNLVEASFYTRQTGIYKITLVVNDGIQLSDYDTVVINVVTDVDVNEYSSFGELQVYPNPASTQITIDFNSTINKETTLNIYSITGESVFYMVLPTNEHDPAIHLNIEALGLQKGIYFLGIQDNNQRLVKQLIIE